MDLKSLSSIFTAHDGSSFPTRHRPARYLEFATGPHCIGR